MTSTAAAMLPQRWSLFSLSADTHAPSISIIHTLLDRGVLAYSSYESLSAEQTRSPSSGPDDVDGRCRASRGVCDVRATHVRLACDSRLTAAEDDDDDVEPLRKKKRRRRRPDGVPLLSRKRMKWLQRAAAAAGKTASGMTGCGWTFHQSHAIIDA